MDEQHEGEAPAEMSSAVRSRFWAGLNHASDQQTDGQGPGEVEPGTSDPTGNARESSAPRDQRP